MSLIPHRNGETKGNFLFLFCKLPMDKKSNYSQLKIINNCLILLFLGIGTKNVMLN